MAVEMIGGPRLCEPLLATGLGRFTGAASPSDATTASGGRLPIRARVRCYPSHEQRKVGALESFAPSMGRMWAERESAGWKKCGGRQEARTPDLRVANAALSQLS